MGNRISAKALVYMTCKILYLKILRKWFIFKGKSSFRNIIGNKNGNLKWTWFCCQCPPQSFIKLNSLISLIPPFIKVFNFYILLNMF